MNSSAETTSRRKTLGRGWLLTPCPLVLCVASCSEGEQAAGRMVSLATSGGLIREFLFHDSDG